MAEAQVSSRVVKLGKFLTAKFNLYSFGNRQTRLSFLSCMQSPLYSVGSTMRTSDSLGAGGRKRYIDDILKHPHKLPPRSQNSKAAKAGEVLKNPNNIFQARIFSILLE